MFASSNCPVRDIRVDFHDGGVGWGWGWGDTELHSDYST